MTSQRVKKYVGRGKQMNVHWDISDQTGEDCAKGIHSG